MHNEIPPTATPIRACRRRDPATEQMWADLDALGEESQDSGDESDSA